MLNVLVLLPLDEGQRARLEASAPEARFTYASKHGEGAQKLTDEHIAAAQVIVGNVSVQQLPLACDLQLLQLNSAGYDSYTAAGTLPAGAAMANAGGAYGQAVSEHLFAMVLGNMKRLPAYRDCQRAHEWRDLGPVTTFVGSRVLVLGAGDIGSHFAQLARAMGAHVVGLRRHAGEVPAGFDAVRTMDALHEELAQADVVASILPSSDATRGLVDEAFFAACKPGVHFANGGRGDLVDSAALIAALESGRVASAALDVTAPEPLPADHPLWDAPNVAITPHVSGGFHLPVVLDNIVDIAAENLRRMVAGEPLRNVVARG